MRKHLPNEREMYIEARFGGLEVTLGDEHGDILSADMTGMTFSIMVYIIGRLNVCVYVYDERICASIMHP